MQPVLLHLPYSPWSERARFALDARKVAYTKERFQPLLGEPALRIRAKRFTGPITVPVLFVDGACYTDSLEIARWANGRGEGPELFPEERGSDIAAWHTKSEAALSAGRGLSLRRVLGDTDALMELVPPMLRSFGGVARTIAKSGVKRTLAKYGIEGRKDEELRDQYRALLLDFRAALDAAPSNQGGQARTFLGAFSFADITIAQALAFVRPVVHRSFRIGDASRLMFEDPVLASEFGDLLAWRDELYEAFRTS